MLKKFRKGQKRVDFQCDYHFAARISQKVTYHIYKTTPFSQNYHYIENSINLSLFINSVRKTSERQLSQDELAT